MLLTELRRQMSKHDTRGSADEGEVYCSLDAPETINNYQQMEMSPR